MTTLALVLVLVAACFHATWNLLAKRTGGAVPFIWLVSLLAGLIYLPLAVGAVVVARPAMTWLSYAFILGSVLLQTGYLVFLQLAYRKADLSVVYPIARGTGPMIASGMAILILGERPSGLALVGTLLIGVGVFLMAGGSIRAGGRTARAGILYALATGVFIASYTLWDKHAVSTLAVPPLLLDWAANSGRAALLYPSVRGRLDQVRKEWEQHRLPVLGVAVLMPLAYILVLTALVFTPVSYVAPAREISILIGTVLGARLLAEGHARVRLLAAALMVAGVLSLAIG